MTHTPATASPPINPTHHNLPSPPPITLPSPPSPRPSTHPVTSLSSTLPLPHHQPISSPRLPAAPRFCILLIANSFPFCFGAFSPKQNQKQLMISDIRKRGAVKMAGTEWTARTVETWWTVGTVETVETGWTVETRWTGWTGGGRADNPGILLSLQDIL